MNPILHALQRALIRRSDISAPVPVYLDDAPPVFHPVVPVDLWTAGTPVDGLVKSIGPYAADPRIWSITDRRIQLADGRTIDRIPTPGADPYVPHLAYQAFEPASARAQVWRMFRPDLTASAFWWPELVHALADILGPAQLPNFAPAEEASRG